MTSLVKKILVFLLSSKTIKKLMNYKRKILKIKIVNFFYKVLFLDECQKYTFYYKRNKINSKIIMYESYIGTGMICNTYALFKEFKARKEFVNFKHYWVINDKNEIKVLKKEFKQYKNVKFISRYTDEYLKILTKAKYLIHNTTFPNYFAKKEGQIYVNTWHSITVKTLGYDIPDGRFSSANVMKNLLATNYLISPNEFTTKIFKESFKLNGIYNGLLVEHGQPRNDVFFHNNIMIYEKLNNRNIILNKSKKIILYAPTWKGENYSNPSIQVNEYYDFVSYLNTHINQDEYQVLIKPHQAVYRKLSKVDKKNSIFIPSTIDTNELLTIVDILISDYSSIYFDFLLTKRPVLFYINDLEDYNDYRGLYFQLDELPGPSTNKLDEICEWIKNIDKIQIKYKHIYNKTLGWACKNDDGYVSNRIFDLVFKNESNQTKLVDISKTPKHKLLFYGGSLAMNGVTSTLLTLFNNINYDKYDVTIITFGSNNSVVKNNIMKINENVRVLNRVGTIPKTRIEGYRDKKIRINGLKNIYYKALCPYDFYKREFRRCFGESTFDYVIDYSGYGSFFPLLFMQAVGAKRLIWQHNDLLKDLENHEKRAMKTYNRNTLTVDGLKSIYDYFDLIVSCGRTAGERNKKALAKKNTSAKFVYSKNPIDFNRVKNGIQAKTLYNIRNKRYYYDGYDGADKDDISTIKLHIAPNQNNINFVAMGRLSPEKNYTAIITAFSEICKINSQCHLYIIGEGDMRPNLTTLINNLHINKNVHLIGLLNNPFGFIKLCNCFILLSKYEGLPIVAYEARYIGMPIILSNFSTVSDVCLENGQLITDSSIEGILNAFKQYLKGNVPTDYNFDYNKYNKEALSDFDELFNYKS